MKKIVDFLLSSGSSIRKTLSEIILNYFSVDICNASISRRSRFHKQLLFFHVIKFSLLP